MAGVSQLHRVVMQYLNKFNLFKRFTVKLIVVDEVVYLKGLNCHEIQDAPSSVLRGMLRISVKSKSIPLQEIQIRLIGESTDVTYVTQPTRRILIDQSISTIINDVYIYKTLTSRLFKGIHDIPFQFTIDPDISETIEATLGSRIYHVETELIKGISSKRNVTKKDIKLVRCPMDSSLIPNESIDAVGSWRGILPYHLSLFSKTCILGGSIQVQLSTSPPECDNKSGVVTQVKIYFAQKMKCPRKNMGREGTLQPLDEPDHFVMNDKVLLNSERFRYEEPYNPEKPFNKVWQVQVPLDMPFKVHPYTSVLGSTERSLSQLSISHYIIVMIYIKSIETITLDETGEKVIEEPKSLRSRLKSFNTKTTRFQSPNQNTSTGCKKVYTLDHGLSELTFRAPIYLLNPLVASYSTAPAYTYSSEDGPETNRSSAWLCTGGKYEVDEPPGYNS